MSEMKIYIDGENFRKGLIRVLLQENVLSSERSLNTYGVRELLEDILGVTELPISYYSSKIKLPTGYKPSRSVLSQVSVIKEFTRAWVPMLSQQRIVYIKAGALKVKSSKKCTKCGNVQDILQEKGVDVRIAADILEDVYAKDEKRIVLFSSDTDLCPALHKAKNKQAKITYVCFADAVNRAVSAVADETITISAGKVCKYFSEAV